MGSGWQGTVVLAALLGGITPPRLALAQVHTEAPARARTPEDAPFALSLEEALRRAERTSERVAIARAGVERAGAQGLQARSELFPQLSASGGYERTLASEFRDLFGEEGTPGTEVFSDLPFGQLNTWRFGFTGNLNLFAGGRTFARMGVARAQGVSSEVTLASTRAQVVLDAASAYFDALLADQLLVNAESTLQQQQDTYEQVRVAKEAGTRPEFDLLRARVAVDNQRPVVLRRRMDRTLAYLRLRQALDLEPKVPLVLTTPLGAGEPPPLDDLVREVARSSADAESGPRAPVKLAESTVEARAAGVTLARAAFLPQLDLGTFYGRVAYPSAFFPGWADFRTNWTLFVDLRIPLFNGLRTLGQVRAAQADLREARERLQETEERSRLEAVGAKEELSAALAVWQASTGTVEEAARAYEIAALRFREGVSTQLELSDARLLLRQAEANRARAARDLQVARIQWALLPLLPLSGQAGAGSASPMVPAEAEGAAPAPAGEGAAGARTQTGF